MQFIHSFIMLIIINFIFLSYGHGQICRESDDDLFRRLNKSIAVVDPTEAFDGTNEEDFFYTLICLTIFKNHTIDNNFLKSVASKNFFKGEFATNEAGDFFFRRAVEALIEGKKEDFIALATVGFTEKAIFWKETNNAVNSVQLLTALFSLGSLANSISTNIKTIGSWDRFLAQYWKVERKIQNLHQVNLANAAGKTIKFTMEYHNKLKEEALIAIFKGEMHLLFPVFANTVTYFSALTLRLAYIDFNNINDDEFNRFLTSVVTNKNISSNLDFNKLSKVLQRELKLLQGKELTDRQFKEK